MITVGTASRRRPEGDRRIVVTQLRGGGGGGDGPRGTISPQAWPPIRGNNTRPMPTIAGDRLDDFSCSTFALQTIVASVSDVEGAASFAARMDGVGEQPGRERPHPRTLDPDPRVGSGVAHAPAAGDWNHVDLLPESRAESARDLRRAKCGQFWRGIRLISSDRTDAVEACLSSVVELGTLVHTARAIAHGTARRDGGDVHCSWRTLGSARFGLASGSTSARFRSSFPPRAIEP